MDGQFQNLEQALDHHEMRFSPSVVKSLNDYCRLLWATNERMNLTRHTNYETFVARDLTDVMQLSELLSEDQDILDIGSGGGVPGLVLAIVRPDLNISVCESVGKKAKVLQEFVDQLGLSVTVYNDRVERLLQDDETRYHCCVARAVGPMWKLLTWLDGKWLLAHRLLAFKGPRWVEEVTEAKARGLTKKLLIKPVVKYPLYSTDKDAEPLDSLIIEAKRALR